MKRIITTLASKHICEKRDGVTRDRPKGSICQPTRGSAFMPISFCSHVWPSDIWLIICAFTWNKRREHSSATNKGQGGRKRKSTRSTNERRQYRRTNPHLGKGNGCFVVANPSTHRPFNLAVLKQPFHRLFGRCGLISPPSFQKANLSRGVFVQQPCWRPANTTRPKNIQENCCTSTHANRRSLFLFSATVSVERILKKLEFTVYHRGNLVQ